MSVVLLVEDEPLVRLVAAEELIEAGYRVLEAHDAGEALALLGTRPDCTFVITDVRMPGRIDGLTLAHHIATSWPHIGILVVSGHARPQASELPSGAVFLSKPYRGAELLHAVARLDKRATPESGTVRIEDAVIVAPTGHVGLSAANDAGRPSPGMAAKSTPID